MKAIIYSRVSTNQQSNSRQVNGLKEVEGFEVVKTFTESISGYTKSFNERPELLKALKYIHDHNVECLMVNEISRFGRRTEEVLTLIKNLKDQGVKIYIQSLGTLINQENSQSEAITKLIITIMSDLARMESEQLSYRIKSGLEERKRKGLAIGRQPGTVESKDRFLKKHRQIIRFLDQGESIRWIATKFKVSPTTVHKVKKVIQGISGLD
jgi:DNA invertase Pin-like site-specific DNA recombinase